MADQQKSPERSLKVCYFGTYRANYSRNKILIAGLNAQESVLLYECHVKLWDSIEDRVAQASGGWRNPRFWWRVISTYWRLFRKHNHMPDYDVMLIGYPGQFDTILARMVTWWRRKPMVLDILMSLHLVAEERGLTVKSPFTGRLIFNLEKFGLKLPDLLISENGAYEAYYCQKFNLSANRFRRVPHGADNRIFYPRPLKPPEDAFHVTYHGTYLPSHGLDAVIGAAIRLRENPQIKFHFFGNGPEKSRVQQIAQDEQLENVVFYGFVPIEELLNHLAKSHICLGVFGETKQSHYTIQNKVWEGLAMGRAVISGDSQVVRESLTQRKHILLVKRDDPEALAKGIQELQNDPKLREEIAQAGYERFIAGNSIPAIGQATEKALRATLPA